MKFLLKCLFFIAVSGDGHKKLAIGPNFIRLVWKSETRLFLSLIWVNKLFCSSGPGRFIYRETDYEGEI